MAINQFPYTNFHELNADWMLQTVKSSAATATNAAASAASAASAAEAAQAAAEDAAAEVEGAAEDAAAALAAATQAVTTANSASSTAQAASTVANQADATASAAAVDAAAALTAAQAASAAMTNPLTPAHLYNRPPSPPNLAQQMQFAYPERIEVSLGQPTQGGYYVYAPFYDSIREAVQYRIYRDIPIKAVIKTDQEGQTSNQSWFFDLKAVNRKGNLETDLWDFYFEGSIINANSTDILGAKMGLSETAAGGLEGILIIQQS